MPNISVVLPEVDQSVSRPVIFDVIGQVLEICKISKDIEIYFPGPIGTMQVHGSDIDGDPNKDRDARFETNRIAFIEVEDTYDPYALATTAVTREEHIPVFEDIRLGVKIAPVYATSNVKINFKYRTNSKNEALRWMDDMRMRISMLRDVNLHKVTYHFALPEVINEVLINIWENRNSVDSYNDNLEEYIRSHMTERVTKISDQVGKHCQMVIGETQTRIQGLFDYDAMPEKPERDDATGTWSVVFSYKFNYEKPIACNMRYPVMVHNELLKPEYINFTDKSLDPSLIEKSFSKSLYAFNSFEMGTIMNSITSHDPFIRIPDFDDYNLPQVPQGTGTVMLVLTSVDETDQKSLLNLNELGDIMMDPDIMTFIKEVEWPYICRQFQSVIHLTLYKNQYQKSSGNLVCDESLNITSLDALSLRDQHRVRIGLCVNLTLLPKDAMDRLRQYPKAFVKIIASMNEVLRLRPDFGSLGDKNHIGPLEFSDIYAIMTGYSYNNGAIGRSQSFYNSRMGQYPILKSIDPRTLEYYRKNMITKKTIQVSQILVERK